MYRSPVVLLCTLGAGVALAAPVQPPPKTPPFVHPSAVGTTRVYKTPGGEVKWVLTKAEKKDDAHHVTITCTRKDETSTPATVVGPNRVVLAT